MTGTMDHQLLKGKAKAGSSATTRKQSKQPRNQLTRVPRAPPLQYGQTRKFRFKAFSKEGKQWYAKHTNDKYIS